MSSMRDAVGLTVWPLLQIATLVNFVRLGLEPQTNPWHWMQFGVTLGFAWFFLCMTLHVTAHDVLHRRMGGKWHSWLGFGLSLLLGISFRYYRINHWNHHRYNNGPGDFTSTWQGKRGEKDSYRPISVWRYGFLWPLDLLRLPQQMTQAIRDGDATPQEVRLMAVESVLMLATGMALWQIQAIPRSLFMSYGLMVYGGWAMVAWHNYGQHLPWLSQDPKTTLSTEEMTQTLSFRNPLYNRFTHQNGLHAEHHAHPNWPTHTLRQEEVGRDSGLPPILSAFWGEPTWVSGIKREKA